MPSYRVGIVYSATEWVEVEAPSEDEAEAKAYEESRASLCNCCSEYLELEDPIEFLVEKL